MGNIFFQISRLKSRNSRQSGLVKENPTWSWTLSCPNLKRRHTLGFFIYSRFWAEQFSRAVGNHFKFAYISACKGQGDVIFVIDTSGSVGPDNFQKVKDFVYSVADGLAIDSGAYRVGVVSFSTFAKVEFYLNDYSTKAEVKSAIQNIPYVYGFSNTGAALQAVRMEMFIPPRGDRPGKLASFCVNFTYFFFIIWMTEHLDTVIQKFDGMLSNFTNVFDKSSMG